MGWETADGGTADGVETADGVGETADGGDS